VTESRGGLYILVGGVGLRTVVSGLEQLISCAKVEFSCFVFIYQDFFFSRTRDLFPGKFKIHFWMRGLVPVSCNRKKTISGITPLLIKIIIIVQTTTTSIHAVKQAILTK
jgi:hypothetical protein